MPALGNRGVSGGGVVKPAVIKAAARRAAPRIRNVPASAPVSVPTPKVYAPKPQHPAPRLFSQPLKKATAQNLKTGGELRRYRSERPAPKPSLLQQALGVVGKGEHFLENAASEGIGELEKLPGVGSRQGVNRSVTERKQARETAAKVGVQAAEALGTAGVGKALLKGGTALEGARAAKGAESALADREALRAVAGNALKARDLAPLDQAPNTAKALKGVQDALAQTGEKAPTLGSRALRVAGGTAVGYGKLLGGATVAKAAIGAASAEPKKNESFVEKFYHDTIHTIANLPAGAIQGVIDPVVTAKAMAQLYTHPKKAFDENSFGTLLAFLAPAAAVERGAGGIVRGASKGRLLSTDRPNLQYQGGATQARSYEPGLVSQSAQRIAELPSKPHVPGLRQVSGKRFKQAVDEARGVSQLHAENLKQHHASEYSKAFLTKDGKAGYALIKTGKKLSDGRPEVQLVNLFRHGENNKGISPALIRHATSKGANTLNAFEGKLTRTYGAHSFQETSRVPNHVPGQPDVVYMERPNVRDATKFQERRDILGSRAGGVFRPGQVDLIRGGERLARNLEVMKAHHFLDQHLPHDEVHSTALIALLQGEAKTAKSFWPDIADRVATLKDAQHNLTGTDLAYNKEQVARYVNMERNRSKLSDADLAHYEKAAGSIATRQREMWEQLNQEGIGHHNQLNARNLTAVLSHGHLMGRGDLHFLDEPGPHPLTTQLKNARVHRDKLSREVKTLQAELRGREIAKGVKSGKHFALEHAKGELDHFNQLVNELRNKSTAAKLTGAIRTNGDIHPGIFDAQGERVTAADTEQFIKEHFGREMGFITHKQDLARARSLNTYGPRTIYPMRTGGNFMAGAYDNTAAALRNHFERGARNLASMRGRRSVAENLVRMNKDGKPFTEGQAKAAADNMNKTAEGDVTKPHLGEWVPYNLGAEKTSQLIEGQPYTKELERQGLVEHKAIQEESKGSATWGILPQKVADRLSSWDKVENQVQNSMLRKMTTPWRQTNLYTSVRWPFGTTQENAIRLAAHQVSPLVVLPFGKYTSLSFGTGSHIVRFLDDKINDPSVPHAQKQLATFHRSQLGTGNFVGSQLHELEPALHQLDENSPWKRITESAPNTKIWRPYRRFVGNSLNKMETNAKIAAGGKLARDDASFFSKFRKMSSEQAAHDYVEKLTSDPAHAIKAAQNLMEIMGNWNHLTPFTRQAQAEWAPFALWWLNSAKFVFKTLPRDHPYSTGLLAAMVTATGQGNRNLKPYLEGTVPLKLPLLGEINLNPVHYSPYDIAGEPLEKGASMIAPQITEPVFTAKGVDPLTGEKFVGDKGKEGNEGTAAARVGISALESYIPGLRLAGQLSAEGGIPTKQSILPWEDTKKLGLGKAALKTFAPFKFNYVRKKTSTGGSTAPPSGGGFGAGSSSGNSYQGSGGFGG